MPKIIVRELDLATAGQWTFADSKLRWQHRRYGTGAEFDPFPAYRHDVRVVRDTIRDVTEFCQPIWDIDLLVANREVAGRTNAFSHLNQSGHYEADEWVKDAPTGLIMMSGKRIPPHPAMARHLVAHEYGHHVEWMLETLTGSKKIYSGDVIREYAELRGLPDSAIHHGEGGTWHNAASEVFACDFRLICCDIEVEYWPHPGVPHPLHDVGIMTALENWWALARDVLRNEARRLDTVKKSATIDPPATPE